MMAEGLVYVYRFDGNDWVFEQKISDPIPDTRGCFGSELEVFGDVIAIAAYCESTVGGCVWVVPP